MLLLRAAHLLPGSSVEAKGAALVSSQRRRNAASPRPAQTSTAIVEWAEAHSVTKPQAPNAGAKHLTGYEVADILRWHAQGLTQEQIAARFEPPKHQSNISRVLTRYGIDNTAEAKRILRGGAASMALNIVKRGQPKDQVQALKGLGVLDEPMSAGLSIQIGVAVGAEFVRVAGESAGVSVELQRPSPLLT